MLDFVAKKDLDDLKKLLSDLTLVVEDKYQTVRRIAIINGREEQMKMTGILAGLSCGPCDISDSSSSSDSVEWDPPLDWGHGEPNVTYQYHR